ncbi:flagellar biosynthesis protein FlgJ [Sphingomonas sp. Leaf357]|uniref:lytic transglycosylase domain-containing protein n=1 Tax=Sphingomonas sp. Leaf357 TaxID=1736350 RepID=UPI0007015768|nr:lytic transglycosylase domain-containing protein [Sphingomonas sp. Leaf357]KQS03367.1 flagellar biosynthesis protein FlgJ [Sphingomonas sp. Leaf357]
MSFNPFAVTAATKSVSAQSAIALASQKTGVDFSYLMGQAQLESGMRTSARSGTSSASGLYQFIDQSWLRVVKQHGAEHGMAWASDAISTSSSGKMVVSDPETRRAILNLRNDPQTASLMAAEHASDNKDALESTLGRDATGTDLYMAHFLGLGGAKSFLTKLASNPDRSAASLFPAAARANRNVFYTSGGQPRSLSDVYDRFAAKLDKGAGVATGTASGPFDTNALTMASAALEIDGSTVIPGNGEDSGTQSASAWAKATLDQFAGRVGGPGTGGDKTQLASLIRPTPASARLAYMMLSTMGA